MNDMQLFAVEKGGIRPLPIPPSATAFADLYAGMELGVYSALRTYEHHKFLWLEQHLSRMAQSARLVGIDYAVDEGVLRRALDQVCKAYPWAEAKVRIDLLTQPLTHLGTSSRLLIALIPFSGIPPRYYEEGVRVGFAETLHRETPAAKTAVFAAQRQSYSLGTEEAHERLLVDEDGFILEGTGSNFYGIRDGMVYTAVNGVLQGITQQIILKLIAEMDIPLAKQPVHLNDIGTLDEAALSSSSRALIPIVQIGERVVGNGRPGPISRRILEAYQDFVKNEIEPA